MERATDIGVRGSWTARNALLFVEILKGRTTKTFLALMREIAAEYGRSVRDTEEWLMLWNLYTW